MAWAEQQVRNTSCILGTDSIDSRGGYDAVLVNESPMLGLSNVRAALQALQLRESLIRTNCHLRWLASDYGRGRCFDEEETMLSDWAPKVPEGPALVRGL